MRDDLKDLVAEALRLNSSMKKDRARLAELKSIILAESQGRNASFKIYTDVGEARFNKRKEKLTYTFDERYFLNLDEETQKKLIDDKIVDKEISYHLNFEKYEIIKKYPDNDIVKSLVKEHFNWYPHRYQTISWIILIQPLHQPPLRIFSYPQPRLCQYLL